MVFGRVFCLVVYWDIPSEIIGFDYRACLSILSGHLKYGLIMFPNALPV